MLLRQIQVYTSHFFDRYKERYLKDLSLNANDVRSEERRVGKECD